MLWTMQYRILSDSVVVIHFLFILFVVFGGFLVFRWPKIAWLHIPAFLWGGLIGIAGWICPLTYLENDLRILSAESGYPGGFVERYIIPLIYPDMLLPGGFPRYGFIAIGIAVLIINAGIYWRIRKKLTDL